MATFNRLKYFVGPSQVCWIASVLITLIMATSVFGQDSDYEAPPVFKASSLLSESMTSGPNHNVRSPIGMEGLHYSFDLWSRFGWYHPESLDMLKVGLAEIQALDVLAQMQQDPLFMEGLSDRMVGGAQATVSASKRPFKTSENIPLGLSDQNKLMDAVSSEVRMFSKEQMMELHEEAVRNLAASLGVDPYTDNVPLRVALHDVAANSNREVLRRRVTLTVVPGVGSALEAAHLSKNLQEMLETHSELNLQKETRKDLSNIGVPKAEIDEFMENPSYPLSWRAAVTEALMGLAEVDGVQGYIHTIQDAPSPEVALFYLRRIQLAEKYHRSVQPLSKMVMLGATPAFVDRTGALAATVPVDYVYWNEDLSNRVAEVKGHLGKSSGEIYITGGASDLAKEKLAEQGLTLHENWGAD